MLMGRGTNRFAATITRLCAIAVAALTASAIASLSTPGAARAAVPDAYCAGPTDNVAGVGNSGGARWAETFSPINGGYLAGVRLFVDEQARYGGTLTVQITPVNTSDLSPVFPVVPLAQATVPDSSLPLPSSYPYLDEVAFDFPNPPAVSASSEYAIVLTRSNATVLGIGIKTDHTTGNGYPCPDGDLYESPGASTPWGAPLSGVDAVFSTFVGGAPTPPTPPATGTGKRAAALKKCKKKKSNTARSACKKKANKLPV
jgi:hypothetical protein